MIDTDKYEGHTPAPWKNEGGNTYGKNGEHIADTVLEMVIPQDEAHANSRLIADAPLLLEEVKWLHFQLDGTHEDRLKWVEKCEELDAEVKRLREQNKLMVDYFRFMRDGGFTDDDWRTVDEWIGDD